MSKFYGIRTPNDRYTKESYMNWISFSPSDAWLKFFQFPTTYHRLPLEEAIRAYQAIGYKCIELEVEELREII